MKNYLELSHEELLAEQETLKQALEEKKALGLKLDMSRGKPCKEQLDITSTLLDNVTSRPGSYISENGIDCRNYGCLEGIPECRRLMAEIMGVGPDEVLCEGSSSLTLMYDMIARAMTHGVYGSEKPWYEVKDRKWLCPAPGYDRHFAVTEFFGFEMIPVAMTPDGPDMDAVEKLVKDPSVKGIWCVPQFSNPQGIVYSDETIDRFAKLRPAAGDFRIFWDNAYSVHDLYPDRRTRIPCLLREAEKYGTEDHVYIFSSTNKITFPSAGIAAFSSSANNLGFIKKQLAFQTIGPDKINQLNHARFFKNLEGIYEQMDRMAVIIRPKFEAVLEILDRDLDGSGVGSWVRPKGGYFIGIDLIPGTAKRTVALCKEAGVVLTPAGAVYPYLRDPKDSSLRLAPTFPPIAELKQAIEVFCIAARLASAEALLGR
ncbi:MAG TPA: aminotransferase [Oscillospiraceae bacterium]|nr:aminotransferase [Oscillospiraceae bacterium]HNW04881.1 aminotransferase [Oscillospiraceae bacterium]